MILLPRMSRLAVDRRLTAPAGGATMPMAADSTDIVYAATGGQRANRIHIGQLHGGIIRIAKECGYPDLGTQANRALFDARAAAWLAQQELLATGEGFRDDMWACLATALARPIVEWRFRGSKEKLSSERFHGGIRNALQRLWVRGRLLDRGPQHGKRWQLLDDLTEDAVVQITERPAIGSDHTLALAVAEAWVRAAAKFGRTVMEDVMRRAIIRIRLRNLIRLLSELPATELSAVLDGIFEEAAKP